MAFPVLRLKVRTSTPKTFFFLRVDSHPVAQKAILPSQLSNPGVSRMKTPTQLFVVVLSLSVKGVLIPFSSCSLYYLLSLQLLNRVESLASYSWAQTKALPASTFQVWRQRELTRTPTYISLFCLLACLRILIQVSLCGADWPGTLRSQRRPRIG